MFLRVSRACWRQLLQFSSPGIMFCKMCVTVALCLVSLLAFSEGFFMPAPLRKQAPQTTFSNPQWIPTPITSSGTNNGANTIQTGFGNPKDFSTYQQPQQPQSLHQSQQQQQQQQPQATYSSQLYAPHPTGLKYEPNPYHPQYAYEGVYPAPLNSYSQSVQLVPCLCPVNKEVLEQQNQQLHQQSSLNVSPTSSSYPAEANNNAAAPPPQANQKKTT